MAHQIEGNKCFFTGKPAWHKLGVVLTDAPSIDDAWKLAYPHEIFQVDMEAVLGDARAPIEEYTAIIRDDGKQLGCMKRGYTLVQPYEQFNTFKPLLESGLCTLEAGGSLNGGKRMWGLAKVIGAESEIVKNDWIKRYLLVFTSFDGSLRQGIKAVDERVVCNNTLQIALDENSACDYSFKHTKNIHKKMDNTMGIIKQSIETFNNSVLALKSLGTKKQTLPEQINYIKNVFEYSDNPKIENSPQLETKITRVIDLLDSQRGLEYVPAARGTAWQSYNAVTEYITHEAGRNEDTRLNSQWFGQNVNLNQRAFDLAM